MAKRSSKRNQVTKPKCLKCSKSSKSCEKQSPEKVSMLGKFANKMLSIFRQIDNMANPEPAPQIPQEK